MNVQLWRDHNKTWKVLSTAVRGTFRPSEKVMKLAAGPPALRFQLRAHAGCEGFRYKSCAQE